MIWGKTTSEKIAEIYSVSKWFAWYPIQLKDGRWIWWEYVWLHKCRSYLTGTNYHYEVYEL